MTINETALVAAASAYRGAAPFDHMVVDDFLAPDLAQQVAAEFPAPDADFWWRYDNPLEVKLAANSWDRFPPATYRLFAALNAPPFVARLAQLIGEAELAADHGLHGGGWHSHGPGGKLNPHLDYNLHPKLGLQRKLNLILYLSPDWDERWGGELGFWRAATGGGAPAALVRSIVPRFNRAVLFDTTQASWHGLVNPVAAPPGRHRNSVAVYYLRPAPADAEPRAKALYAPTDAQRDDPAVLELIRRRAALASAASVYRRP